MQNQMTICPPITANNNSKQYDSTKSPLAMLEQTCSRIGADTLSNNNKSSSQSIDHTKKDHGNGSHSMNKLHMNGYKPSNQAMNQQLASLANNYEGGRRSGNSASVSPASSLEKNNTSYSTNLNSNGSRPNSNGNSRPNSNSSLTSSKGKELSKLSFKPYEEQQHTTSADRRKHHSPELEHLKSLNKSDRKLNDNSSNGLSPKNSANSQSKTTSAASLSYSVQQQQLLEQHLQYQQYMAALTAGYPFNNPSLMAAAAALTSPMLPGANNSSTSSRNSSSNAQQQQTQQSQAHQSTPNQQTSAHPNLMPPQSSSNQCPPGCNTCIIHNPLFSSFAAAAAAPSSVSSSNNGNPFSAQHLAALSSQYPHLPPHFLHLYGLAGYNPSLSGLTPPVTSASTSNNNNSSAATHSLNHAHSQQAHQTNSHSTNSNHNPLSMHHHHSSSTTNSSNHHNNHSTSNKPVPQVCTFMNLNGTFCGKRFNNSDEYLIHLKSHTLGDFSNLNPASLESLYGSYEAMLSNPTALANLRRSAMHDSLSNSNTRFHPYGRPSSASASNHNYSHNSQSSAASSLSQMSPAALSALTSQAGLSQFSLGALSGLNGLNNNLNNSSTSPAALAAAFNMYSQYNGRVGPTVQP